MSLISPVSCKKKSVRFPATPDYFSFLENIISIVDSDFEFLRQNATSRTTVAVCV